MPFSTTLKYVDEAEQALGASLPAGWRQRLLASNGGELWLVDDHWTVFPVFDRSDRKRAARTASNVVHETVAARAWPSFPRRAVAIAANGSGDYLVLLESGSGTGVLDDRVYLWSHETGALRLVANSVQDLSRPEWIRSGSLSELARRGQE